MRAAPTHTHAHSCSALLRKHHPLTAAHGGLSPPSHHPLALATSPPLPPLLPRHLNFFPNPSLEPRRRSECEELSLTTSTRTPIATSRTSLPTSPAYHLPPPLSVRHVLSVRHAAHRQSRCIRARKQAEAGGRRVLGGRLDHFALLRDRLPALRPARVVKRWQCFVASFSVPRILFQAPIPRARERRLLAWLARKPPTLVQHFQRSTGIQPKPRALCYSL